MLQRSTLILQPPVVPLSDPDVIIILVAIIKHQGILAKDILVLPEIKKSKISRQAIQVFLDTHGLVKKIPDSSL